MARATIGGIADIRCLSGMAHAARSRMAWRLLTRRKISILLTTHISGIEAGNWRSETKPQRTKGTRGLAAKGAVRLTPTTHHFPTPAVLCGLRPVSAHCAGGRQLRASPRLANSLPGTRQAATSLEGIKPHHGLPAMAKGTSGRTHAKENLCPPRSHQRRAAENNNRRIVTRRA